MEKVSWRPHGNLPVSEGSLREGREGLFIRSWSDKTRSNRDKLNEGKFRSDIRKKFFTLKMVRLWNRLPSKVVDVPSQLVFKARLDKPLSNLIQWEVSLPLAWGLGTSRSLRSFPTPLTFYGQGSSLLQKLNFLSLQQEHANWKILPMFEAYRSFAIMITFITMRGTLITTWQGKIKSCWGKKIWKKTKKQ